MSSSSELGISHTQEAKKSHNKAHKLSSSKFLKYGATFLATLSAATGLNYLIQRHSESVPANQNLKSPNPIIQTGEQRNWNEILTTSKPEIESTLRQILANGVDKQFIHRPDTEKGLEFANGPVVERVKLRAITTLSALELNNGAKITFREDASVYSNAFPVAMDEDKDYFIVPVSGEPYKGQWGHVDVTDPSTKLTQESGYWGLLTESTGQPIKIDGKPRYVSASQFSVIPSE